MGAAAATSKGQGVTSKPVSTAERCSKVCSRNGTEIYAMICAAYEHTDVAAESAITGMRSKSSGSSGGAIESKKTGFNFDWFKKEEYGTFTGEPPRVSLTDPPPGYQTPSPDQPYGIAPEKKAYKPQTLGERMEIQR